MGFEAVGSGLGWIGTGLMGPDPVPVLARRDTVGELFMPGLMASGTRGGVPIRGDAEEGVELGVWLLTGPFLLPLLKS